MSEKRLIPVGLSNRHLHVSDADLAVLFGEGYELTELKPLSQPGQYAAEECVEVHGPKGSFGKVRILGPTRPETQVEISITDSFKLGIKAPVRQSGDIEGSPGCKLVGPKGEVEISEGVIIAARHIHMTTADAEGFGLKDMDMVQVKSEGLRSITFDNVLVRAKDSYALEMHLDMDEGNAAAIKNGDMLEIIG